MSNVIVIGGGASGMVSAYFASQNNNVILIEQNEKLGKKLYITGKGRCNLTNYCDLDEFLFGLYIFCIVVVFLLKCYKWLFV